MKIQLKALELIDLEINNIDCSFYRPDAEALQKLMDYGELAKNLGAQDVITMEEIKELTHSFLSQLHLKGFNKLWKLIGENVYAQVEVVSEVMALLNKPK